MRYKNIAPKLPGIPCYYRVKFLLSLEIFIIKDNTLPYPVSGTG